jgi:cytidylate kinase
MRLHFVIAIDGLAATGKGTLAAGLAREMRLIHRETGRLYRAVGLSLLERGLDPQSSTDAVHCARQLDERLLADPRLDSETVARAGSMAAAHSEVRAALMALQRAWCDEVPEGFRGVVMEGRDIGSVICPDADVKLYLTADLDVRAQRRAAQSRANSQAGEVAEQLAARDRRDLAQPGAQQPDLPGVQVIDTTWLDADAVLHAALGVVASLSPTQRREDDSR